MRIFAMLLRVLIVATGVYMMYLSGFEPKTPLMCSGIAVVLIGAYLALQSITWPKSLLCPLNHGCSTEGCDKK